MGILKLPNAGDTHTMHVTECVRATGTYGEQVKFSDGTDTLYLPQSSADHQLKRIFGDDFAYTDAVGNALTFSRAANNKRPGASPYWNIAPARPTATPKSDRLAAPTSTPTPSASAKTLVPGSASQTPDEYISAYATLFDRMAQALSLSCASHGLAAPSAEAVQSASATLWIALNNRGWTPSVASVATEIAASDNAAPPIKHPAPSGKRLAAPDAPNNYDNFPPARPSDDDLPF
jgi:hypothetical protein